MVVMKKKQRERLLKKLLNGIKVQTLGNYFFENNVIPHTGDTLLHDEQIF